jgi:hypothetical protein
MSSTPELQALQDFCARLDAAGIAYMLTGSLAASYYARPRMTRDIDVVVALDGAGAARLAELLGDGYYVNAESLAEGVRLRRPDNVVHLASVVKIDLIPRKDSEFRLAEFERRRKVDFAGTQVWIASAEDLILSKLEWARDAESEQQMRDVRQLLETPVDRAYLEHWAERLGLAALLKEADEE